MMLSFPSIGGAAASPSFPPPLPVPPSSPVEALFAAERERVRHLLDTEPSLSPFRSLPDGLVTLLCGEKERLALQPETRKVCNAAGDLVDGFGLPYDCDTDAYHPQAFASFEVMGYWIPESEGELFFVDEKALDSPLVRRGAHGREILFLVHPKSEALFSPLKEKYREQSVAIPALSLSSFRTLLIALPHSQYAMVKVSLDAQIAGASRLLSENECASSVGFSATLQRKAQTSPSEIFFMEEPLSFVPHRCWVDPGHADAVVRGAGMIYRSIPNDYFGASGRPYVVPLFALFGEKNRELLDALMAQSGKTPTECIESAIVRPLAKQLVQWIYCHFTSLEAHGQNLLIALNAENPGDATITFLYRDMGGVNLLLSEEERRSLPFNMQREGYFYQANHDRDAATALELYVVQKVFFNLTKQFFKSESYERSDPRFAQWKAFVTRQGWSENWTCLSSSDPDAHGAVLSEEAYCRYGYFETLFGHALLDELEERGIFEGCTPPSLANDLRSSLEDQAANFNWFKKLLELTYPPYRQRSKELREAGTSAAAQALATPILSGNPSQEATPASRPWPNLSLWIGCIQGLVERIRQFARSVLSFGGCFELFMR